MSVVKIDLERTGFPVMIGEVELFFDCSLENLRTFFNVDEVAQKRLKEVEKKAKHIHFPDDLTEKEYDELEDKEIKLIDAGIDYTKEFVAIQYDMIFGEGTFKKIYKEYPDFIALDNALEPLGIAIQERLLEFEQERKDELNKRQMEALNKIKQKQKNK